MKKLLLLLAFFCLFPLSADAKISHVQSKANGASCGSVTSCPVAYDSAVATNNLLLLSCRYGTNGRTVTISDTLTNSYTLRDSHIQTTDGNGELLVYSAISASGGSNTVTCAISGAASIMRATVSEYYGFNITFDQAVSAEGTGTSLASTALTPSANNALLFAVAFAANITTYTAGTDFTMRSLVLANPNGRLATEEYIQPTAASHDGTFTISSSLGWAAILVVFKEATYTQEFLVSNSGKGNLTWTVPSDWNSSANTIECIGAGGRGGTSDANGGGGGGGSGGFARVSNVSLTPGGSVTYAIGATATTTTNSTAVGMVRETYFDGTASSTATLQCSYGKMANLQTGGIAGSTAFSTGSAEYAGAAGGTTPAFSSPGSGGGGSAGPAGAGKNGGNGNAGGGGGGGGGANGGSSSVGSNGTANGGNGGNGTGGTGGGAGGAGAGGNATAATGAGGAGGSAGVGGTGAIDTVFDSTHGAGGGGGGGGFSNHNGGVAGTYGGGGGGRGGSAAAGADGGQGMIIITYTPSAAGGSSLSTDSHFFITE
jgi:hypothetical protein